MAVGMPGQGDGTVFGEIELLDWLSDTSDGARSSDGACETSVAAGEIKGASCWRWDDRRIFGGATRPRLECIGDLKIGS